MKRVLNTLLVGEMHILHILYYQDPACYVYPRHWGMKMTKKRPRRSSQQEGKKGTQTFPAAASGDGLPSFEFYPLNSQNYVNKYVKNKKQK
jgi:hypothetical protein